MIVTFLELRCFSLWWKKMYRKLRLCQCFTDHYKKQQRRKAEIVKSDLSCLQPFIPAKHCWLHFRSLCHVPGFHWMATCELQSGIISCEQNTSLTLAVKPPSNQTHLHEITNHLIFSERYHFSAEHGSPQSTSNLA